MIGINLHIDHIIYYKIKELFDKFDSFKQLNSIIEEKYHIIDFIDSQNDYNILKNEYFKNYNFTLFENKIEYGDFQTPETLTDKVCLYLKSSGLNPEIIIEPTSGTGNFLISSLKHFSNVKYLYGIELNCDYALYSKFKIISLIENGELKTNAKIKIFNSNIFDFDFDELSIHKSDNILIIGNPPWVTNTTLSILNSKNLPPKSNFKNHNGIDAITGKGNFDISEYILLLLFKYFQKKNGYLSMLVKNSVVKNLLFDQLKNKFKISNIKKLNIDAQKEFNVSVDACIIMCELNKPPDFSLNESTLDNSNTSMKSGWHNNSFVSNIDDFKKSINFEGKCQFEWRSGIKHDCSKILEFKLQNGKYVNKINEQFEIENDLVYSFLKGSYLKNMLINSSDLFTIITQKFISEDTDYIKNDYPKTFKYLIEHERYFINRKSSIYNNKPKFSIFGVGKYSFKPYKVAIAALYKEYKISLILPDINNKPIMLDDTCYFLSFDNLDFALITYSILNHEKVIKFIDSLTFNDIMRKYNKELLMRIDFDKITQVISLNDILRVLEKLLPDYLNLLNESIWNKFKESLHNYQPKLVKNVI